MCVCVGCVTLVCVWPLFIPPTHSQMVFYVSSHVGVLLDISDNTQMLLQGHAHSIVATAVSGNKRWIVTADIGPNSTLIVWDSYTG